MSLSIQPVLCPTCTRLVHVARIVAAEGQIVVNAEPDDNGNVIVADSPAGDLIGVVVSDAGLRHLRGCKGRYSVHECGGGA